MNVIKRDGSEVIFTREKIINAITKANNELPSSKQLNKTSIQQIAYEVEKQCQTYNRAVSVEEIQDMVEKELLKVGTYDLTKNYMIYRYYLALSTIIRIYLRSTKSCSRDLFTKKQDYLEHCV